MIGSSILSGDPNEYTTKAFAISGSCKREYVEDQQRLLQVGVDALRMGTKEVNSQLDSNLRVYAMGSDGDSRRRRALINITLKNTLSSSSPIYELLSSLSLFNLRCGEDDITCDFDWKHILKRFRNTDLRAKGFSIDGVPITTSVIKAHLVGNGMSPLAADILLAPNDRQDVVLMIKLLHAIALLPPSESPSPLHQSARRILRLLGRIYFNLLTAYMDVKLSLNEQLVCLSTAAHLILAIYHTDKGEFIPVQTCFDVMCMIKNVYFCVAKTQIDDPTASFWIILLGTDGLEKVFGQVRTMVGNDTHADQLQLTNRIDGAVQCVKILENHPEWGGQSRRLSVKPLSSDPGEISSIYDHINPKSWRGDVRVQNVVLAGCWSSGRWEAETRLQEAQLTPPFSKMESKGGYDILCPFGGSKMMLVDGTLTTGECEETDEETEHYMTPLATATTPSQLDVPAGVDLPPISNPSEVALPDEDDVEDLEPDFDDAAGMTEVSSFDDVSSNRRLRPKYDPWIFVDGKKVHKATILRLYSNPLAVSDSKDRLKRVRGFSQYDESVREASESLSISLLARNTNTMDSLEMDNKIYVQDPALILVRCNKKVFLAVFQILALRIDLKNLQSIPCQQIHEPNVYVHGQVIKLALLDAAHQPDGADWEWNGAFEACSTFQNAKGRWIEPINPDIQQALRGQNTGKDTYAFRSSDLRAIALSLQQRVAEDFHRLPEVPQTPSFPYRSVEGKTLFLLHFIYLLSNMS